MYAERHFDTIDYTLAFHNSVPLIKMFFFVFQVRNIDLSYDNESKIIGKWLDT